MKNGHYQPFVYQEHLIRERKPIDRVPYSEFSYLELSTAKRLTKSARGRDRFCGKLGQGCGQQILPGMAYYDIAVRDNRFDLSIPRRRLRAFRPEMNP